MNHMERKILTASLVLFGLAGEINSTPAAAASHYPLWVCGGRYGGWGWSRPSGPLFGFTFDALFRAPAGLHGYEYWYPAFSYDPYAYAYAYPYPYPSGIYVQECGYWSVPR
jgi:hypothetical protein